MLSADVLFLKDQNQSNFFCSYFPHENTEDVSREAQSIAAQLCRASRRSKFNLGSTLKTDVFDFSSTTYLIGM